MAPPHNAPCPPLSTERPGPEAALLSFAPWGLGESVKSSSALLAASSGRVWRWLVNLTHLSHNRGLETTLPSSAVLRSPARA